MGLAVERLSRSGCVAAEGSSVTFWREFMWVGEIAGSAVLSGATICKMCLGKQEKGEKLDDGTQQAALQDMKSTTRQGSSSINV